MIKLITHAHNWLVLIVYRTHTNFICAISLTQTSWKWHSLHVLPMLLWTSFLSQSKVTGDSKSSTGANVSFSPYLSGL